MGISEKISFWNRARNVVAIVGPGVRGEGSIMSINRYKQRDEVLRSIGFQSYKEYLS